MINRTSKEKEFLELSIEVSKYNEANMVKIRNFASTLKSLAFSYQMNCAFYAYRLTTIKIIIKPIMKSRGVSYE
jgi:hypothetical protein